MAELVEEDSNTENKTLGPTKSLSAVDNESTDEDDSDIENVENDDVKEVDAQKSDVAGEGTISSLKGGENKEEKKEEVIQPKKVKKHKGQRTSHAKIIKDALIKLSKKYEDRLTIDDGDIISKEDKIDAIILQLKLPHVYSLNEDEQKDCLIRKYGWIDDEDEDEKERIDEFEYERIQGIAHNMIAIEKHALHDTMQKYDEDDYEIRAQYEMVACKVKTMRRYKKMLLDGQRYVCSGCGVLLKYEKKTLKKKNKTILKRRKSWRGYVCEMTGRECIFHSRLCVKLRKAKEYIRDRCYEYSPTEARMTIDFLRDEKLHSEFEPNPIFTTFEESSLNIEYIRNIRVYRHEVENTDLRGYDIDTGDRFANVPVAIKYLDMREYAIAMVRFLMREVSIKEFSLFWEFLAFFSSYIDTPKLVDMVTESSSVLFPLHTSENGVLVEYLTVVAEGALYPIATCLYLSAFISENGERYWDEDTTGELARHFRNMANSIIDEYESMHLVAVLLDTPTNICDGSSVIDIAIRYRMLVFLQNSKISSIATTLWHERKIIHPKRRFGTELTYSDLFRRLSRTPAKFYFSPSGMNIITIALYIIYLILFSYVTMKQKYNYEDVYETSELLLWFFNIGSILFVLFQFLTSPTTYLDKMPNIVEFTKAIIWILLFFLKFVYAAQDKTCPTAVARVELFDSSGEDVIVNYDCSQSISVLTENSSIAIFCKRELDVYHYVDCDGYTTRNSFKVEIYMFLWAVECVLFWMTPVFFMQRLRSIGPLLKMIGLMTQDMINFLLLVCVFWFGASWGMYFVLSTDLSNFEVDSGDETVVIELNSIGSLIQYAMLCIFAQQDWENMSTTSDAIGHVRSFVFDSLTTWLALVGSVLLLNLLIAMLSSTYQEVMETTRLEVNFTRVVESYNASRIPAFIPPPFNYFAVVLMFLWFLADWTITCCTVGTKRINDWYFTPLNRTVFSAGDFIEYQQIAQNNENEIDGVRTVTYGYVQHQHTCEVALVVVADQKKYIHKKNILKIEKSCLSNRNKSGKYYCKYCRYLFHGDQVGNVDQVSSLFRAYGILLDEDDTGRLKHQLGEHLRVGDSMSSLRIDGCAQICPECYRPFFCSADHSDEIVMLQYLGEICSFWIFMLLLYLPLVIVSCMPALITGTIEMIIRWIKSAWARVKGEGKLSKAKDKQALNSGESDLRNVCEQNDIYRANVRDSFEHQIPFRERVYSIAGKVKSIHKRIRDTQNDDEQDNIVTRFQNELADRKLRLEPEDVNDRLGKIENIYAMYHKKLNELVPTIEEYAKKKKERKKKQDIKRKQAMKDGKSWFEDYDVDDADDIDDVHFTDDDDDGNDDNAN